jgi:hypothetical protein
MARLLSGPSGLPWVLAAAGINASNEIHPSLAGRATSLTLATGRPVAPHELEAPLVRELRWALTTPGIRPSMVAEANGALAGVGRPIRLRDADERIDGELLGLSEAGTPRVRLPDGGVVEAGVSAEMIHDE